MHRFLKRLSYNDDDVARPFPKTFQDEESRIRPDLSGRAWHDKLEARPVTC